MMPASPWMGSSSTATVSSSIAAAIASASPNGTDAEPGRVRAEAAARGLVVGEADDRGGAAVEVVVAPPRYCASPAGTPLTSVPHLRATLMPLSTASAPLFIGSTMSLPHSSASAAQNGPEPVGVERAADQRHGVELRVRGCDDLGVAVPEVDRRVGGQAVQVAAALDVGDPGALGAGRDHRQRRVVVRDVAVVDGDRGVGAQSRSSRCPGWSRMYLQRAAFDGSAALEQLGQIDADRPEPGLAQSCSAKPVAAAGMDDVAGRRTRR